MKHHWIVEPGTTVDLSDYSPDHNGPYKSQEDAGGELEALRVRLAELQGLLYADNRFSALIILQGMDASGKDGTVRHVMSGLTPLGVHCVAFKAPNAEELEHDYLWRVHKETPRRGEMGIFNRSHYEDVLIARVHDLVPKKVWERRYAQINDFERMLAESGTVILKFFLHISKGEQKKRFEERLDNPKKYWKFNEQDIAERHHWSAYMKAYERVLSECSTKWAPWTIVPANAKWYRNLVVAQSLVNALEGLKMRYPPAHFDRSKIKIK